MVFNKVTNSVGGGDGNFTLLPRGQYIIQVFDLIEEDNGNFGPQVKWVFHVFGVDGKPILKDDGHTPMELWGYTPKNINKHPQNRTRPWLEAFLGRELREGESGESIEQEVLGKKANAYVTQVANKTNGKLRNQVQDVYPMEGASKADPGPDRDQDSIPF